MTIQYVTILKIAVKKAAPKGIQESAEISTIMETVDTKINVPTNKYNMRNGLSLLSKLSKVCSKFINSEIYFNILLNS